MLEPGEKDGSELTWENVHGDDGAPPLPFAVNEGTSVGDKDSVTSQLWRIHISDSECLADSHKELA